MPRTVTFAAALALLAAAGLPQAQAQSQTRVGMLTCSVSGGIGLILSSQKSTLCTFRPRRGPPERYVGVIRRFGLDIGATQQGVITWAVFAQGRPGPWSLAGNYAGATAEATVGAGLGANVLVGGSSQTIALQPVSLTGQTGLNLAVGIGDLILRPAG